MSAANKKEAVEGQDVITINDVTTQILTNAQLLFANEKTLKVVTTQAASGLIHHATILAEDPPDIRWPNGRRTYREILKGPGQKTRRQSMMGLLEETEKRAEKALSRKAPNSS